MSELAPLRRAELLRVLLLEDDLDADTARAVVRALERTGRRVDVEWAKDEEAMRAAMRAHPRDVVVSKSSAPASAPSSAPVSGPAIAPELARKLSHDFINTFSVISSYVDFLLTDLEPAHPSRKDVEAIQRATQRGLERVRQLLEPK